MSDAAQEHYADSAGRYIGSWMSDDPDRPAGAILVPPPPNGSALWIGENWELSLVVTKDAARRRVISFIDQFLGQFTKGVPDAEVASWPTKATAARLHLVGEPQQMILIEARVRGVDAIDLAEKIIAKAEKLSAVTGAVSGLRGKTAEAIEAAKTPGDVDAAVTSALTEAGVLAKSMGLSI